MERNNNIISALYVQHCTLYYTLYKCIMPLPQEEYSPFLEGIGIDRPSSSVFRPGDVPADQRATGLILKDIGQVLNDDAVRDVRCSGLMKANKDKLCDWLEIFVCLVENYTDQLLSAAC